MTRKAIRYTQLLELIHGIEEPELTEEEQAGWDAAFRAVFKAITDAEEALQR